MPTLIFPALCTLFVLGLVLAGRGESQPLKRFFKPPASLSFILAGLAAGALDTPFGQAVLAALVFCAIGDVLLIPKSKAYFLAGMASFGLGHAAYIAAFSIGGVAVSLLAAAVLVLMLALSAAVFFWLREELGAMKGPVAAYSLIISFMVAAGAAHFAFAPSAKSATLAAAAAAFALSDVSVARDRFGKGGFINRLWGLPLYYAAQCLFAISV